MTLCRSTGEPGGAKAAFRDLNGRSQMANGFEICDLKFLAFGEDSLIAFGPEGSPLDRFYT
jgi:hypothetical protein